MKYLIVILVAIILSSCIFDSKKEVKSANVVLIEGVNAQATGITLDTRFYDGIVMWGKVKNIGNIKCHNAMIELTLFADSTKTQVEGWVWAFPADSSGYIEVNQIEPFIATLNNIDISSRYRISPCINYKITWTND